MDGWKTYRDEKLGYEIQYPIDIYTAKFKIGKGIILWKKEHESEMFEVGVSYLTKSFEGIEDKVEWTKDISLDGLAAKKRKYFLPDNGSYMDIRVRVGMKMIQLLLINAKDNDEVAQFEKIAKTFKVIR